MIWVAVICVSVVFITAIVIFSNDSYKKGKLEGTQQFWQKLGVHIERNMPITLEFKNANSGLKFNKEYELKEIRNEIDLKGSINFSVAKDGEVCISILEENWQRATLVVPADKIPKSLQGKTIEGSLSF